MLVVGSLCSYAQDPADVFGSMIRKLASQQGNLAPDDLRALTKAAEDANRAFRTSKGTQDLPPYFRSPAFFEDVLAVQPGVPSDANDELRLARAALKDWIEAFVCLGKPTPSELKLANDTRIMILIHISSDIKKARADGVNEKHAMHDNGVTIGVDGRDVPRPPRDKRPSILAGNLLLQERIFSDVWMSFVMSHTFDTVEQRSAYFLLKGCLPEDFGQMIETVPVYWRNR